MYFFCKLRYMEHFGIKCWAEDDRPREKLMLKGKHVLSDAELLAIILGSGTRRKTAVELAKEILSSYNNNLGQFARTNINELKKFNGVGEAKAINILAALELGRRRKDSEIQLRKKVYGARNVYELLHPYLADLEHEEFYAIYLNAGNLVLKIHQISVGGINTTVVDSRKIFHEALQVKATGIILAHNHPSGNLKASEADIALTKRISEFGKLIDIAVLDHVIYTDNGYLSFVEEDLMIG